jgi:hypothetical protein
LAVWAVAIVAAVIAAMQRAQGTGEMREQLKELERRTASLVEPERPAAASSRATPKFGAVFYESTPSRFEGLLSWPGAVPTIVAAVLALASGGILLARRSTDGGQQARYQQQLMTLRASHDSLALLVQGLRDSVRAVQAPAQTASAPARAANPAGSGSKGRPAPAQERTRTAAIPPAPKILPAAPALDPVASGSAAKPQSTPR